MSMNTHMERESSWFILKAETTDDIIFQEPFWAKFVSKQVGFPLLKFSYSRGDETKNKETNKLGISFSI